MISKKTYKALLNWQPVTDRIISARFNSKVRNITIIQCYALTELANDNEKDLENYNHTFYKYPY